MTTTKQTTQRLMGAVHDTTAVTTGDSWDGEESIVEVAFNYTRGHGRGSSVVITRAAAEELLSQLSQVLR